MRSSLSCLIETFEEPDIYFMMYSTLLLLVFVTATNAQYCLPCEATTCSDGACWDNEEGCAQCNDDFVPHVYKPKTRGTFGTCVEECDSGRWPDLELPDCQEGYQCKSNGCGHTCQKITNNQERQIGFCVEECSSGALAIALDVGGCAEGYECRSNGCGHSCQKVINEPVVGVCAELCGDKCPEGQECFSNGCGHSCQPVSS